MPIKKSCYSLDMVCSQNVCVFGRFIFLKNRTKKEMKNRNCIYEITFAIECDVYKYAVKNCSNLVTAVLLSDLF